MRSNRIYLNYSTYSINISGFYDLELNVGAEKIISLNNEGPDVVTEDSYQAPFKSGSTTIRLSNGKEFLTTGITDRKNYTVEKISARHYKFTYTFTDADFVVE